MGSDFTPVAIRDRIQALDVVRGVALLGIALMNVEFFNRPIGDLDAGLPAGVTGIDYWAGWFVQVFVRGKFWTMFSLLFGMGFAVMLARAEQAGRGFAGPYFRRTLALAVIGVLHFIFLWTGDILFSYATGALLLMLVFYAKPQVLLWLGALSLLLAVAFGVAGAAGHALPWQPMLGLGVPLLLFGVVAYALRRWPLSGLRRAWPCTCCRHWPWASAVRRCWGSRPRPSAIASSWRRRSRRSRGRRWPRRSNSARGSARSMSRTSRTRPG
jgi:hypothetical protein